MSCSFLVAANGFSGATQLAIRGCEFRLYLERLALGEAKRRSRDRMNFLHPHPHHQSGHELHVRFHHVHDSNIGDECACR